MEEIYGVFHKIKDRDIKTGKTTAVIKNGTKYTICKGICRQYFIGTPVKLIGDYEKKGTDYDIFNFNDIIACGYNKEVMVEYLSGKSFRNIGKEKAEKILLKTGTDIFSYVREKNDTGYDMVTEVIRDCVNFEDFFEYIKTIGGDFHSADLMYKDHGYLAINVVKHNPYKLLSSGISYELCEKIAKDIHVETSFPERVNGLVYTAFEQIRSQGHTKVSFKELCKKASLLEEKSGCGYVTNPLFIAEEVVKRYITEEENDILYVYRKSDYENEQIIADNIARLKHSAEKYNYVPNEEILKRHSEEQKLSFNLLKSSGVKIIRGGPGTGKSTTIKDIISEYVRTHNNKSILLTAPTGAAARRLSETTGLPAVTVHNALKLNPFSDDYTPLTLPDDCIILDEASMVDTETMAKLLSSIKNGALFIILGDSDQLPSIEAGDVLRDLVDCGLIEDYKFTTIFRQSEDNLIILNSKKVLSGNSDLSTNSSFRIIKFNTEKELHDKVINIANDCFSRNVTNFNIYAPARKAKFLTSTTNFNKQLRISERRKNEKSLTYGDNIFSVNDKVIFTKNIKDKFFNGQTGIISDIQNDGRYKQIYVDTPEGIVEVTESEMDYLSLAYAITVYKSQGSECDNAIIVIPKKPTSLLKRRMLYVGITRAKKNVIILTEDNALETCISTFGEYERITGLKNKLIKALS